MGYFNPETYEKMLKKFQASGDAGNLEQIWDDTKNFIIYVHTVCKGENKLNTTINPDRAEIGDYDSSRHRTHEDAIISASVLNNLAKENGFDPVYTGDLKERHQVAAFCLELAGWLFENRRRVL